MDGRQNILDYYCVTLSVSVVLAIDQCPSVCLSHSSFCVQTAKDIVKLFSLPDAAPSFYFFG